MHKLELTSSTGIHLVLCREGASIAALYAPDRNGMSANICMEPDAGRNTGTFSGATIAPAAGRIRNGIVQIAGELYQMPLNDGPNCLHSGPDTLGQALWDIAYQSSCEICFQKKLADGKCGLPGNRIFTADYTLSGNTLSLVLSAVSDQDTFINMTNHTYWNLSGNPETDAYDHELKIASDAVWYNDENHLPQEMHAVKDSVFDYRQMRKIRDMMRKESGSGQLSIANGYNNAFALNDNPAVRLYHPGSGRMLTIQTDAPYLVFYSGGYLPAPGSALAFEPQYVPDAPYLLGSKLPVLKKGRIFRMMITFRLDTI